MNEFEWKVLVSIAFIFGLLVVYTYKEDYIASKVVQEVIIEKFGNQMSHKPHKYIRYNYN